MRPFFLCFVLAQMSIGCRSGPVVPVNTVTPRLRESRASRVDCAIYATVLQDVYPAAQSKPPVLMDSTFNRVYQSAFRAWTNMRVPASGSGASIVSASLDSLRAANLERRLLPACPATARLQTVRTDSLRALFSGPEGRNGWNRFYVGYPNSSGFTGLSRIAFNNDSTEAIMYVAHHSDWLSGHGTVFRLQLTEGRWLITDRRVVWRS
jgi:hypothetical protein